MGYRGPIKTEGFLEEFFVVTESGAVYKVATTKDRCITATKIFHEKPSQIPVGAELPGHGYLAITSRGMFSYDEHHPRVGERERAEDTNTAFWYGGTSSISALFLGEDKARECAVMSDLQPADPRWKESTLEVLEKIGDDHPRVVPSRYPSLSLWSQFAT